MGPAVRQSKMRPESPATQIEAHVQRVPIPRPTVKRGRLRSRCIGLLLLASAASAQTKPFDVMETTVAEVQAAFKAHTLTASTGADVSRPHRRL